LWHVSERCVTPYSYYSYFINMSVTNLLVLQSFKVILMPLEDQHVTDSFQNVKPYSDTVCNNITDSCPPYVKNHSLSLNYCSYYDTNFQTVTDYINFELIIYLSICNYAEAKRITRINLLPIVHQLLHFPSCHLAIFFTHVGSKSVMRITFSSDKPRV
jgi:hypothetical protein